MFYNSKVPEPYMPQVIQWFQCARYGHTKVQCRSKSRCSKCSDEHTFNSCSSSVCLYCGIDHAATEQSTIKKNAFSGIYITKKIKENSVAHGISYEGKKLTLDSGNFFKYPCINSKDNFTNKSAVTCTSSEQVNYNSYKKSFANSESIFQGTQRQNNKSCSIDYEKSKLWPEAKNNFLSI